MTAGAYSAVHRAAYARVILTAPNTAIESTLVGTYPPLQLAILRHLIVSTFSRHHMDDGAPILAHEESEQVVLRCQQIERALCWDLLP